MQIPTSFRLMAHRIRVKSVPEAKWKHTDCIGMYSADKQLIELRDNGGTLTGHVFTHELTHAILSAMGHKLNNSEAFVDQFSGLLSQALETAQYPRQPRRPRKVRNAK